MLKHVACINFLLADLFEISKFCILIQLAELENITKFNKTKSLHRIFLYIGISRKLINFNQ